jgi:hypothetical protein
MMSIRSLSSGVLALVFLAWPAFAADQTAAQASPVQLRAARIAPVMVQARTFKPVTAVKIRKPALMRLPNLLPVAPDKPVAAEGPDPSRALDLGDIIEDPALLTDLSDACGWDGHLIFQDKAAGHVFYYLPQEFLLRRDESGYLLSVQYNHRAKAGEPSVMLTAELAARQRDGEVPLLKAILRQALDLAPGAPLELNSIKGLGAQADLAALTTGLALGPERLHLTPPAHLKQPFRLTLALTQEEVEEVLAQMAREGVAGNLLVKVGEESVPVPIRIGYSPFSGEQLAGFDRWVAGKTLSELVNVTDFPLQVTSINAYRLKGQQLERVSKEIKQGSAIPPGGRRPFKLPPAEQVLGGHLMLAWAGTTVDGECQPCLAELDRRVRQGVALAPGENLSLEAIPSVFDDLGLYKVLVQIRSPYFVAGGSEVKEKEIQLTADNSQNSDLRIFMPADRGPDPLLYRYRLVAVTETGETFAQPDWTDGTSLSLFIGSAQLEPVLPEADSGAEE